MIGLDSAALDLVLPWTAEGALPSLNKLMTEGAYGTLRSTIPAISPAAWTTFMTGKNPGKHGTIDFAYRKHGTYKLGIKRNDLRSMRTIFRILSDYGFRVCVVNVPTTYPPEEVNGVMISGLGAPDRGKAYFPSSLAPQLMEEGYRINLEMAYTPDAAAEFLSYLIRSTREKFEIIMEQVVKKQPFDFFMFVFRDIDTVQSFYWHDMDPTHPLHDPERASRFGNAIKQYHQVVDELIGEIIDWVDDDTTIYVVSDHGAGPLLKDVYLNNWLAEAGYLTFRTQSSKISRAHTLLRSAGVTRERLTQLMGWALIDRFKDVLPSSLWEILPRTQVDLDEIVDWSKTAAYSYGSIGQIYVNLKGREPQGTIDPGTERERLVERIIDDLRGLSDPDDGMPVVTAVYRRDDIYKGPYVEALPDINVIFRDMSYASHFLPRFGDKSVFGPPPDFETGMHRQDGLYIVWGPEVEGRSPGHQHIQDVAPTILRQFGVPVPTDMDGTVFSSLTRVSARLLSPLPQHVGIMESNSAAEPRSEDAEDDEEVLKRLKELGYLD